MYRVLLAGLLLLPSPVCAQTASDLVNRARAYMLYGRWEEAIAVVDEVLSRHPHSRESADARYLRNKARLFKALALADDDPPLGSAAPLIKSLRMLTGEPLDDVVAAAKLALGTVNYVATNQPKPERLVTEALRDWQRLDAARPPPPRQEPFVRDVIDIRNIVFQSYGRRVSAATSHLFVRPDIRVQFDPDRSSIRVVTYESVPGHSNVIFLDDERRVLIDRILRTVGTARKRSWMRRGPRRDVLTFWSKASFGTVGRHGGWSVGTHLRITSIEFLPAAGTVAKVRVVGGESDRTVWMEKTNGAWAATRR